MFYKYLEHLLDEEVGIEGVVYCHYIIVMKRKSDTNYVAITILNIPPKYLKLVDMVLERKKKKNVKRTRNSIKR